MPWYPVIKTINGRKYLYLQMTYREGGKVKTKNKYLGPAAGGFGKSAPINLPASSTPVDLTPETPVSWIAPETSISSTQDFHKKEPDYP